MFSGGDYEEVQRWLGNFVASHAKRENPRIEGVIESEGPREGVSYGVRLRLGEGLLPPRDEPPIELGYAEVARQRGSLAWCGALAERVRGLARRLSDADPASLRSA
jgi:hypothetical protein